MVHGGVWLFFNTQIMSMLKVIDLNYLMVDVLMSAVFMGASGAVIAWAFDRFK